MAELPVVDDKERERIRDALKSYMQAHGGIGAPELRERIAFAVAHYDPDLSTLQRFLRGTHRTDDYAVRRYREFLEKVAPPPAGDELGAALADFCAPWTSRKPAQKSASAILHSPLAYAGSYLTRIRALSAPAGKAVGAPAVRGRVGTIGAASRAKPFTPWSRIILEEAPSRGFLRAREIVGEVADTSHDWLGATGVFTSAGIDGFIVVLRSFVSTRMYHLTQTDPGGLRGIAVVPDGLTRTQADCAGSPWSRTDSRGPRRTQTDSRGPSWRSN